MELLQLPRITAVTMGDGQGEITWPRISSTDTRGHAGPVLSYYRIIISEYGITAVTMSNGQAAMQTLYYHIIVLEYGITAVTKDSRSYHS